MRHLVLPWSDGTPSGKTACGVRAIGLPRERAVSDRGHWRRLPDAERCPGCERGAKK